MCDKGTFGIIITNQFIPCNSMTMRNIIKFLFFDVASAAKADGTANNYLCHYSPSGAPSDTALDYGSCMRVSITHIVFLMSPTKVCVNNPGISGMPDILHVSMHIIESKSKSPFYL
jgi:hypothetical protein